jgi:hypothetical protein
MIYVHCYFVARKPYAVQSIRRYDSKCYNFEDINLRKSKINSVSVSCSALTFMCQLSGYFIVSLKLVRGTRVDNRYV